MPIIQDFSDIHVAVYDKALFHITNNQYIVKGEFGKFILVDNSKEIAQSEIRSSKYPFSGFWLEFSLGIEYLVSQS